MNGVGLVWDEWSGIRWDGWSGMRWDGWSRIGAGWMERDEVGWMEQDQVGWMEQHCSRIGVGSGGIPEQLLLSMGSTARSILWDGDRVIPPHTLILAGITA